MATIVIVMPTYNEASCIGEMIETLMGGTFPDMQADMHLLTVPEPGIGRNKIFPAGGCCHLSHPPFPPDQANG